VTLCVTPQRRAMGVRALTAFVSVIVVLIGLVVFPWSAIGLGIINRIDHGYTLLALNVIAIPIIALAIAGIPAWRIGSFKISAAHIVVSLGFLTLVWSKILHAAFMLALGGQASTFGFEDLKSFDAPRMTQTRIVTLMDTPNPAVMSGYYGLPSFGGNILLNVKSWNDYWQAVHRQPVIGGRAVTRPSVDWKFWNGQRYAIAQQLDLDLLRRANVGFLISPLPLEMVGLDEVLSVPRADWPNLKRGDFSSFGEYVDYRLTRMIDPGRHHIYAVQNPVARIRPAKTIKWVADDAPAANILAVLKGSDDNTAVLRSKAANGMKAASTLQVLAVEEVTNGYDIRLDAPEGGLLIINNQYLPFWKATADGAALPIITTNLIEMAVSIAPGVRNMQFRYQRSTIRQRL